MKFATSILLLLVAVTSAQDEAAAAEAAAEAVPQEEPAPVVDCAPICTEQATASAAGILGVAQAIRAQLTKAEGLRQEADNQSAGCTREWEEAVAALTNHDPHAVNAESAELKASMEKTVNSMAAVQAALEEMEAATKKYLASENEARTQRLPEIARYREKREEVSAYVMDKQKSVTKLAQDIEQLTAEPDPIVNVNKIQSDMEALYNSLVSGAEEVAVVAEKKASDFRGNADDIIREYKQKGK